MTNKVSPEMVSDLFFTLPRLVFVTVKSQSMAYQKIGKINDMLRRVATHYFIVREKNKQNDGFHFHALVSLRKDMKPNWFRKGVHINVKPVNNNKVGMFPTSEEEHYFSKYGFNMDVPLEDKVIIDTVAKCKAKDRMRVCLGRKGQHIERTVNYMFKDFKADDFREYVHYIYTDFG